MASFLWIGGIALLAIVGGGLFFAIQRPDFVAGLIKSFVTMAINALLPIILKRKSPEEEKLDGDAFKSGERRPTKQQPHPGEGGHH